MCEPCTIGPTTQHINLHSVPPTPYLKRHTKSLVQPAALGAPACYFCWLKWLKSCALLAQAAPLQLRGALRAGQDALHTAHGAVVSHSAAAA
jgi:hypothetical protein